MQIRSVLFVGSTEARVAQLRQLMAASELTADAAAVAASQFGHHAATFKEAAALLGQLADLQMVLIHEPKSFRFSLEFSQGCDLLAKKVLECKRPPRLHVWGNGGERVGLMFSRRGVKVHLGPLRTHFRNIRGGARNR